MDINGFASRMAYKDPTLGLLTIVENGGKKEREWVNETDICSIAYLTSAEEYPDDEYLDMSKSSSLKQTNKNTVSLLFVCLWCVWGKKCINVCLCSPVCV